VSDRAISQAQVHHIEQLARRAIARRLGYAADHAVFSVERDGEGALLHVNSGGNALAAQSVLGAAGYRVEDTDYDPFAPCNHGVVMRVLPTKAVDR
jgi:hypothetical protein